MLERTQGEMTPSGGVVHLRRERRLASGHWLLASATASDRPQVKAKWSERRAAWLRPGVLFSAVSIPAGVLHAALGLDTPRACAGPLAEVLEHGPAFYRPGGSRGESWYTLLLPARVARLRLPLPGVLMHPQHELLLVPAPDVTEPPEDEGPWWVSSLDGPALLCPPERVAALSAFGRDVLTTRTERNQNA